MSDQKSPPTWYLGQIVDLAPGVHGREIIDAKGYAVGLVRPWHAFQISVAPRAIASLRDCVQWMEEHTGKAEMQEHDLDNHKPEECVLCTARQVLRDSAPQLPGVKVTARSGQKQEDGHGDGQPTNG